MRFMVIVKATQASEAGEMPSEELLAAMGRYNEELVKAGVMLAGEGLQPSAKGARVRFSGNARTVIDGPFAETRELIAGFWMFQVASLEEAIGVGQAMPEPIRRRIRDRDPPGLRGRGLRRGVHPGTARARGAPARRAGKTQLNRPALRQERGKRHANRPLPDLQR
ncbi:dehydrogenase [Pseudomonas aeruginosa]|nr:dehydrogenase [Pseudomonas aeruginosa]